MERQIIIGLITSTNYIKKVRSFLKLSYFETKPSRMLASWCLEYFEEFKKAPVSNIENIIIEKVKSKQIDEDFAEEIAKEILPDLNEEYSEQNFNIEYTIKQTKIFCSEKGLEKIQEEVDILKENGKIEEAEEKLKSYKPINVELDEAVDLGKEEILYEIDIAFDNTYQSVLKYPGALGKFWNHQLIRGGFIGIMAPEKRGKTFMLLDMGIRGAKQGSKVAFFQAGDMTKSQQLKRICIYLAKKSDKEKYTGKMFIPVKDCIKNQLDTCDKAVRESDYGIFMDSGYTQKTLRNEVTFEDLKEAYQDNKKYKTCHNCKEFQNGLGTAWLKEINVKGVLTAVESKRKIQELLIDKKKHFKLDTYANGTLSVDMIESALDRWQEQENFNPDIIIIDYADLLVMQGSKDERTKQNEIWKRLRGLSQKKHCLVVTATQTDAKSYETNLLSLKNFSEDKRKYGHVTAFYGLNQDKEGNEKRIGIMRINELVLREGDFDSSRPVRVLQKLSIGRPFLTSYF